ncbi:hypothetical protein KUTeg_000407 [Tegillarca granosa]|uniref:Prolyl endopeptidase n=1 Tax=Tegillarca granosa TaxID=220873 RepID=A0ABQ9FXG8_TEGGR|nr:hypothetical protein KUTeg_000407 [Tegillarca granosa]
MTVFKTFLLLDLQTFAIKPLITLIVNPKPPVLETESTMKFKYPEPRRDDSVVEDYHGNKVSDPYRWMEDPDSEETKRFVDAQNAVSGPFIDQCPVKKRLYDRIKEMWDYPKYSCPYKRGDHYFYYYNSGLQNQSVLYVQESLEGEASVFLDPNKLSEDGTISLRGTAFSENGQYFAYQLSKSGSDWVTIKVKKAPSGEDLPDILENVKFSSLAWTHDHKGFFYNYITNEGSLMVFKTNLKSPHYKLITIDFSKPEKENWKDLVAESDKDVLEWAACVNNNKLILCYLEDVKNTLYVHDLASGKRLANFPVDVGSIAGYSGKKKHSEIFYQFVSFLTPGIIYRCDISTDTYQSQVCIFVDLTLLDIYREYGETWHKGGMLANKQNCFDDFQCAAEYLIQNKYTQAKRVMDMLRFHKFTIGHAWTTDYGCSEKPDEFKYLIKYSPLHNIKVPSGDRQYPSMLLLTADHDDRVSPLHSLKFIAELQHTLGPCEKQTNPLMIRIDTKAGHGAGKPTAKIIEELTDVYCFVYQTVGLKWTD